jgi:hypothetical protein
VIAAGNIAILVAVWAVTAAGSSVRARIQTWQPSTAHAQRDDMSKLWFMPATPVLSSDGTTRGLAILKSSGSRSVQITARDPLCPAFIEGAWEHLWAEY